MSKTGNKGRFISIVMRNELKGLEKKKLILVNAFSLAMLPKEISQAVLVVQKLGLEEAKQLLERTQFESAVSHQSTAQVLSYMLGMRIEANRKNVTLTDDVVLLVFQIYKRPAEGQVYTTEEMKEIIEKGLFDFYLVYSS